MYERLFSRAGLSLDRIRTFCSVAEAGSIVSAAGGDPSRQTLYSRQIKELETYLQVTLFRRRGRRLFITDPGRHFFGLAKELLSALEQFTGEVSDDQREWRLGSGDSVIQWVVLPRFANLPKEIGGHSLVLRNLKTDRIVTAVSQGDLDFGIVRRDACPTDCECESIGQMSYSLFVPGGDRLQQRAHGKGEILGRVSLAGMEGPGKFNEVLAAIAQTHAIKLNTIVQCSSFPMMAKAVKVIGLSAVLPSIATEELSTPHYNRYDLRMLAPLKRELVICWSRRHARINEHVARLGHELARTFRITLPQ